MADPRKEESGAMDIDLDPSSPRDLAKLFYVNALRWLCLWNILLYAFGVTVVLFSITSIVLFLRSTVLPGMLTTLGTIVTGSGIAWVVNQKATALQEVKDAFDQLKSACGTPGMGLIGIEQQPWFSELRSFAWRSLGWPSL